MIKFMKHSLALEKTTVPLIIYLSLMAMGQKYLRKQGGRFYCLFVDFSEREAFDKVNHAELIHSLIQKGVHGKFLNLLVAMYCQLCTCVKLDNQNVLVHSRVILE